MNEYVVAVSIAAVIVFITNFIEFLPVTWLYEPFTEINQTVLHVTVIGKIFSTINEFGWLFIVFGGPLVFISAALVPYGAGMLFGICLWVFTGVYALIFARLFTPPNYDDLKFKK